MIELIFGDSTAGALSLAMGLDGTIGGASSTCVIITTGEDSDETTVQEVSVPPYTGPALESNREDIAPIWLMADIGDIRPEGLWPAREALLREIDDTHRGDTSWQDDGGDWIQKTLHHSRTGAARLQEAAKTGEPVRIWWGSAPGETCGCCWAMSLLAHSTGPVYSVKAPAFMAGSHGCHQANGLGDLTPEQLVQLAESARPVPPEERRAMAAIWRRLAEENAPLRAVVNGQPCSVPADFYDFALRRAMPEGECKVIMLIGRALNQGPGGLSDWWYAKRIRHMLDTGELRLVKKAAGFYHSVIRRG